MHVQHDKSCLIFIYIPEDKPRGAKHVEYFKIKSENITLEKVYFVSLYCIMSYFYKVLNTSDLIAVTQNLRDCTPVVVVVYMCSGENAFWCLQWTV
jgi:hypothetical protein